MERVCVVCSGHHSIVNYPSRDASYYNANVEGKPINDIAWYYPDPKPAAQNIKDYVAFYKVSSSPSARDRRWYCGLTLVSGGFQ